MRSRVALLTLLYFISEHSAGTEPVSTAQAPTVMARRPMTELDLAQLREIVPLTVSANWFDFSKGVVRLSPDGKHFVFQVREPDAKSNSYATSWFVTTTKPGGAIVNVGDAGDIHFLTMDDGRTTGQLLATSDARWSPDGRSIAYIARHRGEAQLWRSRADGSQQDQLTHSAADVRDFRWSMDGRWIYFVAEAQTRDAKRQKFDQEAERGFLIDGRFDLVASQLPFQPFEKDTELWIYDVRQQQERRATQEDERAFQTLTNDADDLYAKVSNAKQPWYGAALQAKYTNESAPPAVFNRGQRRIAFARVVDAPTRVYFPETQVSAVYERRQGRLQQFSCTAEVCTGWIDRIWWSSDGAEVYFTRLEGVGLSTTSFYGWSPKTGKARTILTTGDVVRDCQIATDELICWHEAYTHPKRLVALALSTGKLVTLVDPNPELKQIEFGQVERLEWTNERGYRNFGYLIKPLGYQVGTKYPLAILTYKAQGFVDNSTGREYPAPVLAAHGIMVFVFDRPNDLILGTDKNRWDNDHQDERNVQSSLETAIKLLEKRELIDSNRIAITGLSNGAALTFYALINSQRKFATAIVSNPTWEPIAYYLFSNADRDGFGRRGRFFDKDGPIRSFFAALSPSLNGHKIDTPILLNLAQSEVVAAGPTLFALREYGRPYEAYVFSDERHMKWQPGHRYNIYRRNSQWLQFWLQDREVSDPVDPQQYDRWRLLRNLPPSEGRAQPAIVGSEKTASQGRPQ